MSDEAYEEVTAPDAIAVVGIAGRFPGADDVDAFWRNIRASKVSISHFTDEELEDDFSPEVRASEAYVRARSVLENVDHFDAGFFGMYPREAALTDPQHRLFLETAWQALEDAGYDPAAYPGSIGVFAGASLNTYFLRNVMSDRGKVLDFTSNNQVGSYGEAIGAMPDFLTTRVAYKLNLRGPAVAVSSACSTSLLAIAQAVQSLQLYQSDMAIAGGVSVTLPQKRGFVAQEGGLASRDGVCRPFDAEACGTVFGSGVGAVLLKRLEDAIADGDHIYAMVRGVGVNNDGSDKVGFTAPSVRGQAEAIAQAQGAAGIDPASVGYLECHGTATPLGDPIEFEGLMRAFQPDPSARNLTALGSVKANVGHLDAAAGVTSFIKAVLCLHHEEIPPLTHFKAANPRIDLDKSPFYAPLEIKPWPAEGAVRRAGVSSFGVGGTNVHVVLEEAPRSTLAADRAAADEAVHILPLSARSEAALQRARLALADRLDAPDAPALADVAYTLQEGRRAFSCRTAVAGRTLAEAVARLRADVRPDLAETAAPRAVFMFPGQGSQYPDMGRGLYDSEPLFRELIDEGAEVLKGPLGLDLRDILYGTSDAPSAEHPIRETRFTQPALFLVEYATARLWMARGVEPDAMIGHSVGEFVAACLAGVMSFADALRLIALRGRLMQERPAGAMLSVRLPEAELRAILPEGLDVAAINAPSLCVVAGPHEAVDAFAAQLEARGAAHRKLVTSHAFHSSMMDAAVDPFAAELAKITLSRPTRRFASCVTGTWITDAEAVDPAYWARHLRACVRFGEGLATVVEGEAPVLIECGPGRTLATFAGQGLARGAARAVVASLPDHERASPDEIVFAEGVGRLWSLGALSDWAPSRKADGRRTSLPTYPFERESHWIQAPSAQPAAAQPIAAVAQALPAAAVEAPVLREAVMTVDRKPALCGDIVAILEDLSGETVAPEDFGATFIELGFDSLFLGQVAQKLQSRFGIQITFRQLLGDIPSIDALAAHLDGVLPASEAPAAPAASPVAAAPAAQPVAAAPMAAPGPVAAAVSAPGGEVTSLLHAQVQAMQQLFERQISALQGMPAAPAPVASAVPAPPVPVTVLRPAVDNGPPPLKLARGAGEEEEGGGRFKVYRSGAGTARAELSNAQTAFIADVVGAYNAKTPGSKAYTAEHRAVLADPRAANGFRSEWKELVYPLVVSRAKGSKLWDVDGNEYVDLVNGFGQTAFGHSPDFVVEAIEAQLKEGFPIGPQSPMAGETAQMIADMVGMERVTFCNTGSEAVMAAMRVARTVTGKSRIVAFNNDYHGQFDEVLIRSGARGQTRALPVAPGIPNEAVSNMVVLPYGRPESLEWVRENAKDLAAVIVEPIQSRHPELRPVEFLKGLREITAKEGCAFIFDEVVTGFRVHPGGLQHVFGIKADLATYGKVLGGGMPIGILAGTARFMDALDGGQWRYGDDSVPEVAPTFFAGTFVRHPLVLAAVRACMLHMREHGPALQERLAERTAALVARLNADFARRGLKSRAETYSSWFVLNFGDEDRLGSLFYAHARLNGVHVLEGFPCFLTTQHSDADIEKIYDVFTSTLDALQGVGILPPANAPEALAATAAGAPASAAAGLSEAPLTEPQTEIWMAAQMGEGASCAFNESLSLRFEGAVDVAALQAALNEVVARHDILRATFVRTGEKMVFAPSLTLELPVRDVSGEADPEAALADLLELDACTAFDLVNGPLVRAALVWLAADKAQLVLTGHHIVCDGWTLNIIVEDLAAFYSARVEGRRAELPAVLPYSRYAADQAAKAGGSPEVEAYWLKLHADPAPLAELPTDRPRPAQKTWRGATYVDRIDADLYRAVKKAGGKQGATLFSTLFATLQVLFGRLSDQTDIVLAVPTAGQSLLGDQVLAGHAVNFLPLRQAFDPAAPFAGHLKAVQAHTLEAFDRQDFTFGTLVRKLGLRRDPNRLPLTEIQFNLEKLSDGAKFAGLEARLTPNPKAFSNFDIFFNVIESKDGLRLELDYATDLFDESTIARWVGHFRNLLAAIAADATTPIRDLPLLSAEDRRWLLEDLNDTAFAYPRDRFLHDLIAEQAARTPGKPAAAFGDVEVTYGDLDAAANRLARRLQGAVPTPGARVAVAVERSLDMLTALIAVMKAGLAYVPVDPTQPAQRLSQVLDAAEVSAMVCSNAEMAALAPAGVQVVDLAAEAGAIAALDASAPAAGLTDTKAAAYVIFTSGSTGAPKGVEVSHRALVNFLSTMARKPGFTADDVVMAVTTISFDIAGLELFLPLITGGKVVICARDEVRDGFALVGRIEAAHATVVQATPSLWRILLEAGFKARPGLKMLCGGEPLPRDLADALLATGGEVWNVYGPTETTIWSSAGRVPAEGPVTIGEPIGNTQLFIVDRQDRLAAPGVVGELLIGGDGLANGYFNRPDLTAAAFVTLELEPGASRRLYRTGDVGRRLADGSIQLLGRRDHQVKVRGFRIELEEVETVLRRQPGVVEAAAAVHQGPDGTGRLVGYYVGESATPAALAEGLSSALPDYMTPTLWVKLDALPLTQNGKLDRKALPAPDMATAARREIVPPTTPFQRQLADIWREVLKVEEIGVNDNLFALGADSLHVFRIAARMIQQELGFEAKDLLKHPTIAELEAARDAGEGGAGLASGPSLRDFRGGARRRSTQS